MKVTVDVKNAQATEETLVKVKYLTIFGWNRELWLGRQVSRIWGTRMLYLALVACACDGRCVVVGDRVPLFRNIEI